MKYKFINPNPKLIKFKIGNFIIYPKPNNNIVLIKKFLKSKILFSLKIVKYLAFNILLYSCHAFKLLKLY
jgi:hypothetical protein